MMRNSKRVLQYYSNRFAFDEFYNYQKMIEKFLKEEEKQLEKKLNEFVYYEEDDPGHSRYLLDKLMEDHQYFTLKYTHNFRSSFYIQIISFLEYELKSICQHHHRKCRTDFSINHLKGNSEIDKAKLYLTRTCKIDFNRFNPEWNFLLNAKEVRNILVHNQSQIKLDDSRGKKVREFLNSKSYFKSYPFKNSETEEIEGERFYIVNSKANEELLEMTKMFFRKLLEEEFMIL